MIKAPTVLILGAGASADFHFPTGRPLLLKVVEGTRDGRDLYKTLLSCGLKHEQIRDFNIALDRSGQPSVDLFLERREEFLRVGKAAIAASLIPCERRTNLKRRSDGPHWYEYLFNLLSSSRDEFANNRLSVITFNYDRSLEEFLVLAIGNTYGLVDQAAVDLLRTIPILHVHGSLGGQLYYEDGARPFSHELKAGEIMQAAEKLRIVHEAHGGDEFDRAQAMVKEAREVLFLGFGFHETNVKRLRLHELREEERRVKRWFASRKGIAEAELARIKRILHPLDLRFGSDGEAVLDFLRNVHCLQG